jgi:ubiquinone/menaquinone biosynthesis C-methylase UbiE
MALLSAARLEPGLRVADLACGPGDPTLEIATRVAPGGSVTGVDISDGALEVARERADKAGLTNISFRSASVESLPFPDAAFDRVVSRFGVMFFDPLPRAVAEIRRVLAPGGRLAFMVWGPFEQPYFQSTIGVVLRSLGRAGLPPEKSVPFQYATPGKLEAALRAAQFTEVESRTLSPTWAWADTPEEARDVWWSGAIYFRELMEELSGGARSAVRQEIADAFRTHYKGKSVRFPLAVRLITGLR